MIGQISPGTSTPASSMSNYLINFNAADWANAANARLQEALNQGIQYSEKYAQQAANALQAYDQKSQQQLQQGFKQAQALNAPQRLASYNALDAYQDMLGLARPTMGSFQLASALQNQATGQPNIPQQEYQATGFNQGLFGPTQKV